MTDVSDLIRRSTKAVCGITERELNVRSEMVPLAIKRLKEAGFRIIGTSPSGTRTRKIWFIRMGGF